MSTSTIPRHDPTIRPSTPGQVKFLVDLVTQIGKMDRERGLKLWADLRLAQENDLLSFTNASAQIDLLKAERNELRAAANETKVPEQRPTRPQVPEGRYAVDTDEGHLAFYHVRVSDKGFYTVAVMASSTEHELPWKAAQGVLQKIEVDAKAAAIRYGKELGVCGICGRPLTNEESRAAGIGPICAARY